MKENIDGLEIKEFYNLYQKAKAFMQNKKILAKLNLLDERNYFCFYKFNLTEIITQMKCSENEKINENHILKFSIYENCQNSNSNRNTVNNFSIEEFHEQNTLSFGNRSLS